MLLPIARRLVTPPNQFALDVPTVKSHLRIDNDRDDALITIWIAAAQREAEKLTGKKFFTQTWEFTYSAFPYRNNGSGGWAGPHGEGAWLGYFRTTPFQLPLAPAQAVNSIKYIDPSGTSQTFGTLAGSPASIVEWTLIQDEDIPRIILNLGQWWPLTAPVENAVTINVDLGITDDPDEIPPLYQMGMLLMCGHFNENRETVVVSDSRVQAIEIPLGIRDLLTIPKAG
jgi:hypothetical protein